MTKYILHGGKTSIKSEDNNKFFSEIIKDLLSPINLLIVYFSRGEEEWPKLLKQDKEIINSIADDKKINFVLANKDIEKFVQQIKDADGIYMRGGKTNMLKEILAKIKNLKKLFTDKVIAGSSAGAYVLSRYYMNSMGKIGEGLGILPIKTLAHYKESRKNELDKLKNYGDKLTTYSLKETKFVVFKDE